MARKRKTKCAKYGRRNGRRVCVRRVRRVKRRRGGFGACSGTVMCHK